MNRKVGGVVSWYERLESASRRLTMNSVELKGGYLVAPLDMAALVKALEEKPKPEDGESSAVLDAIRNFFPNNPNRAKALIAAVLDFIEVEMDRRSANMPRSREVV
jgi:hypothetical protein